MKKILFYAVAFFLALFLGAQHSIEAGNRATVIPGATGWGSVLIANQALHTQGGIAKLHHQLFNHTSQDLYARSSSQGGNGCEYRLEIIDSQDRVVWEPMGYGCFFAEKLFVLPAGGGNIVKTIVVPLLFQNQEGIGIQGDPLPAGDYKFRFRSLYYSPRLTDAGLETPGGLQHQVEVPVKIVP